MGQVKLYPYKKRGGGGGGQVLAMLKDGFEVVLYGTLKDFAFL